MPRSVAAETGDRAFERAAEIERYRDNWVHHVLGIAAELSRRVVDRLERECGYARIRPSLGPFISLVWREPRPLSELAQQLSISRQACSKVARLAEQDGYVDVGRHNGDRTQLVRLTEHGRELVGDSVRLILEEEASYSERIGSDRLGRLNAATSSLFFGLGLQHQTDAGLGETARRSIGVLPIVANRVEEELHERTRAKGHDGLQLSHARLIALLGEGEMCVSQMARLQGVSRQATGATVRGLESLGYVRRDPHETDGRAVHVRLTGRGEDLIRDSLEALEELEQRLRKILGARRFADLVSVAAELHGVQALDEEILAARCSVNRSPVPVARASRTQKDRELRSIAALLEQRLGSETATRLGRLLCDKSAMRRV
jgi:DNA-binding MarR family transcriptional regulator